MSPSGTMLDAIDRGFLKRLADRPLRQSAATHDAPAVAVAVEHEPPQVHRPAAAEAGVSTAVQPPVDAAVEEVWQPIDPGPLAPLVDRLLHAAPRAWEAIARRVEDAHRDGASVIAVAGARRGEGRTTLVQCLARTLAARGRRVEVVDKVSASEPFCEGRNGGPIVLVDAGVWFPGGPIRRASIERASVGCHAAILVRREGQPECAARGTAIEAVGLRLLGEVLTMVPAEGIADAISRPSRTASSMRRET